MTISTDLFRAISPMQSHFRGKNLRTLDRSEVSGGIVSIGAGNIAGVAQAASVHGLAYKLTQSVGTCGDLIADQATIISYGGTDQVVCELPRLDLPVQ